MPKNWRNVTGIGFVQECDNYLIWLLSIRVVVIKEIKSSFGFLPLNEAIRESYRFHPNIEPTILVGKAN